MYDLTVIVPVFNEEDNMAALENRLGAYLGTALRKTCVLFVNDGSKDSSLEKIKAACERNPDFYYISLEKNSGLSTAMKAGIDAAVTPIVGYIDADLQTAPEDFNLLLPYIDDYEIVIGIRAKRKDSFFKNLQSKIANNYRRMMTGDKATDTGCPLKIMRTDYAKRIPFFKGLHRFLPAMIALQGGRMKEIEVRHFPRTAGVSKYHLWNRLAGPFMDCFAYRWMKSRYINYSIAEDKLPK